jgi:hypothetical protein
VRSLPFRRQSVNPFAAALWWGVRRVSEVALLGFVALMAVDVPRPFSRVSFADLAMALAAAAWGIQWLARRVRLPSGAALPCALAYLACAAASALVHRAGGWKLVGLTELCAVLVVTGSLTSDERFRRQVLRVWCLSAAALCAIGLVVAVLALCGVDPAPLYVGSGELSLVIRPAGLCRSGMLAEVALVPLLLLLLDGERWFSRRWRGVLVALLAVTIALTLTRTILSVVAGLLVAHGLRTRRWTLPAVGLALLFALALASVRVDIHGAGEPGIRWRIAESALHNAAAHPLTGVGLGVSPAQVGWPRAADRVVVWDAHSTVLDLAATLGLPALLAFGLLVLVIARAPVRNVALVAALYATLFDALTIDVEDFRHVWLLLGLLLGIREEARRERRAPRP